MRRVTRQTIQTPTSDTHKLRPSLEKKRASPSREDVPGLAGKRKRITEERTPEKDKKIKFDLKETTKDAKVANVAKVTKVTKVTETSQSPRDNFKEDSVWNISKAFENKDGLGRRQLPVPKTILTYSKRQRKKLAPILPDELTDPIAERLAESNTKIIKTNGLLTNTCVETGTTTGLDVSENSPGLDTLPREEEPSVSKTQPRIPLQDKGKGKELPLMAVGRKTLSLSKKRSKIVDLPTTTVDSHSRQTGESEEQTIQNKKSLIATEEDEEGSGGNSGGEVAQRTRETTPPVSSGYVGFQRNFTTSTPIRHGMILPDLEDDDNWLASPIRPQGSSGAFRSPGFGLFQCTPHTDVERVRVNDESRLRSRRPNFPMSPVYNHRTVPSEDNIRSDTRHSLTQEQLKMTVEDYLRSLMEDKIAAVKRRGDEQINEIEKQVDQVLSVLELQDSR
ncbi:hypothetical protein J3Q64DRAFT_1390366 [Phycomyces blakesleeanus]